MKNSRVIIIEDDVALRKSLSEWLANEYLVTEFESAEAFLEKLEQFDSASSLPACMLLDFQMTGMTGVQLQSKLMKMNIVIPIIFMSGNAQQADIIDAWHGGAVDFLLKPFTGSKVSETLRGMFDKLMTVKRTLLAADVVGCVVDLPITQREAEVLILLGKGHRQHEIAKMLNITLRTVKWHRAGIKNKLKLNTLVELTRYCDQHMLSIQKVARNQE